LAQVAFLPDPVCARLAMALMDEGPMKLGEDIIVHGKSKRFWVERMSELFCTGLCRPHQGDLGEIATATYLLFCGDLLRKRIKDDYYQTFSVSLDDFVRCVVNPWVFIMENNAGAGNMVVDDVAAPPQSVVAELPYQPHLMVTQSKTDDGMQEQTKPIYSEARVSFIQVVRNSIRMSVEQMVEQDFLTNLYESGCAVYVAAGSHHIDMLASIRLTPIIGGAFEYVPLLVSVKTLAKSGNQMVPLDQMAKLLTDAGTCGICIRLLFDFPADGNPLDSQYLMSTTDVNSLFCGQVVSKVVVVDENDPFGIVKTLLRTTSMGPARAEVYSSHQFANVPSLKPIKAEALVRSAASEELVQYVEDLKSKTLSIRTKKRKEAAK
jgi:hypothetical protein